MLPAQELSVHWLDSRPGLRNPLVLPFTDWRGEGIGGGGGEDTPSGGGDGTEVFGWRVTLLRKLLQCAIFNDLPIIKKKNPINLM